MNQIHCRQKKSDKAVVSLGGQFFDFSEALKIKTIGGGIDGRISYF